MNRRAFFALFVLAPLGSRVHGVRPEWFGAVGDGVHDDYSALQTAIDVAEVLGGRIHWSGHYVVSQPLRV